MPPFCIVAFRRDVPKLFPSSLHRSHYPRALPMNRREAVRNLSLILGGVLSSELTAALYGQVLTTGAPLEVSLAQEALLAEAADTIIPATDTPGAKAAGVEKFIVRVLRDCYRPEAQMRFYEGLSRLDAAGRSAHGKPFTALTPEQRHAVLLAATKTDKAFFLLLKQLTVAGYFTSEIGATKALAYLPIPGRFQGETPLQQGQKAWAL